MLKSVFRRFRLWVIQRLCGKRPLAVDSLGAVCILAPHPDDETFGCGQLIAEMTARNKEVSVIFCSSGGASHKGCCNSPASAIEAARCQKAKEILADLGVRAENIVFLNMPDGELTEAIPPGYDKIKQLVERKTSAALLAPHPLEGWRDHEAVAELARKLAADTPKELFYYCVWFYFSMPFRKFHKVQWAKAYSAGTSASWRKKDEACRKYLTHIAPCGKPYAGVLPDELIKAVQYQREFYFSR